MAFTIRKPLTIELPRPQQDAADERKRARLAEETEKFLEEATRRATQTAQQQEQPADFMARAVERAKEIAAERGPAPEPPEEEGGGGFLGGLRDVGRGALGVGRGIVRGIDVGLEAVAPIAGDIAERGVRAAPVGQAIEAIRAIPGVPTTGGGPTITDFARRPFVPGAAQIGQATEFAVREPLAAAQAEVEFGRPITEPIGRALGRGAVAALPLGQVVDVATQGRLSDIAEEVGGVVAPELAVLSNAVPVEAALFAGPKLLFRGTRVASGVLEVLGRVAKGGATIDTLEVAVKSDLAKFADDAARAVELRPVVRAGDEALPATAGGQLFHETSPDRALQIFQEGTAPARGPMGRSGIFVSDSADLALGQGDSQGAIVVFRGDRLATRQVLPPGQPPEFAERLGTNFRVEDAAADAVVEVRFRNDALSPQLSQHLDELSRSRTQFGLDIEKTADETIIRPRLAPGQEAVPERLTERFGLPAEQITTETRIPPGVSREAPLTGQQIADLPVGQAELPFPRTRNAQEIAQLAGERRNNLRAVQEGAEAGTNSVDDVLAAEAELAVARQSDTVARLADVEDLTKTSFDELIENARKACRG